MPIKITSITPGADAGAFKTASVVTSWGTVSIQYQVGTEAGTVHAINADVSALAPDDGTIARAVLGVFISAVAKELLAQQP